jgi:Cu(I)-responsive transcriptional regulator
VASQSLENMDELRNVGILRGSESRKSALAQPHLITIGQLAREAGVTPRAIRHYERLGLIDPPIRTAANYRLFDNDNIFKIKFIAKCRSLGFSIPEITDILRILEDPDHTCAQVVELTREHLDMVDKKIEDLTEMHNILAQNLVDCTGKNVPECPVLDFLQKSN